MRFLSLALMALWLTGCVSVSSTAAAPTDVPQDPEGGPLKAGLTVRVKDDKVIALALPTEGTPRVADYIIQRGDDPSYVFHVEATNPTDAFRIEVSKARFYSGKFSVKVYMDKAATPEDTGSFNIP